MTYVLHIKEICIFLRERATHCKIRKIRLKIRRPQGHGGSTPPPGTISCAISSLVSDIYRVRLYCLFWVLPVGWRGKIQIQVQCTSTFVSKSCIRSRQTRLRPIAAIYARLRNARRTWYPIKIFVRRKCGRLSSGFRGHGSLPRSPQSCASSGETAGFTPLSSEMVCSEQPSSPSPDEAFRNLTIGHTGRQLKCWLW
jgi:hypothetical protein